MKLDKIKFAQLISYITSACDSISYTTIETIDNMIDIEVPEPKPEKADVSTVERLMSLMQQNTQKIEAIKVFRDLTGAGLKESKDAVERYWVDKSYAENNIG